MTEKTLAELKAIASQLGITPDGDKRLKSTWISALEQNCGPNEPEPEEEPEDPPTEPFPFPTKEREENYIPKYHEISVSKEVRYRYTNQGICSDWIRYDGPLEELRSTLKEAEKGIEGICHYKGHKIQVTPLLELHYKSPLSDWLKFPLEREEDIQEGLIRLHNWIDKLAEFNQSVDNEITITSAICLIGMEKFRRNCVPITASPRPP